MGTHRDDVHVTPHSIFRGMGSMDGAVRAGERVAAEIDVLLGDKVAPIA
jgi:hypothetical protein